MLMSRRHLICVLLLLVYGLVSTIEFTSGPQNQMFCVADNATLRWQYTTSEVEKVDFHVDSIRFLTYYLTTGVRDLVKSPAYRTDVLSISKNETIITIKNLQIWDTGKYSIMVLGEEGGKSNSSSIIVHDEKDLIPPVEAGDIQTRNPDETVGNFHISLTTPNQLPANISIKIDRLKDHVCNTSTACTYRIDKNSLPWDNTVAEMSLDYGFCGIIKAYFIVDVRPQSLHVDVPYSTSAYSTSAGTTVVEDEDKYNSELSAYCRAIIVISIISGLVIVLLLWYSIKKGLCGDIRNMIEHGCRQHNNSNNESSRSERGGRRASADIENLEHINEPEDQPCAGERPAPGDDIGIAKPIDEPEDHDQPLVVNNKGADGSDAECRRLLPPDDQPPPPAEGHGDGLEDMHVRPVEEAIPPSTGNCQSQPENPASGVLPTSPAAGSTNPNWPSDASCQAPADSPFLGVRSTTPPAEGITYLSLLSLVSDADGQDEEGIPTNTDRPENDTLPRTVVSDPSSQSVSGT